MNRFALNFICKNESHVIVRMLESVRPFTDLIVAWLVRTPDGRRRDGRR